MATGPHVSNVPGVLVHGGAGDLPRSRREAHASGCRRAARAGAEVIRAGGSALDAVQRAVEVLEDDPCFNAGTGAALTLDGTLELDASLMDGGTLAAGAVCGLGPFRHPIAIARAVLDDAQHVFYAAGGAEAFALAHGFARSEHDAMVTTAAREQWERVTKRGGASGWAGGTVGAVAFDGAHVAAATSTGGTVGKRHGRVGDSPVIGAGTLADDARGAASATGAGEAILRVSLARDVCERMARGEAPGDAARSALEAMQARVGGAGGLIVMAPDGTPGLAHTTETMSRAWAAIDGTEWDGC